MSRKTGVAAVAMVVTTMSLALSAQVTEALKPPGTVATTANTLTSPRVTANEYRSTMRMFGYTSGMASIPYNVVAGKIYTATCTVTTTGQRKMFASLGTKSSLTAGETDRKGTIITADVSSTGAMSNFRQTDFPLCDDMNGIVVQGDCSTVAALCKAPPTRTGATKDLVEELPQDQEDMLTRANSDHMWLYVWNSPSMSAALPVNPSASYIIARNLGRTWQYGHRNIVMSSSHYGASLKTSEGGHESNQMVVVSRSNPAIDTTRGWIGPDCSDGHAHTNVPAVSATDSKFVALCTTDGDNDGDPTDFTGGIHMRIEGLASTRVAQLFMRNKANQFNGGANSFIALPGGGFMGVYAAPATEFTDGKTNIYLVRFNKDGAIVWRKLARAHDTHSLGFPQLGYLGKDSANNVRLLVGWGRLFNWSDYKFDTAGDRRRIAGAYTVQEFNVDGVAVSEIRSVTHGWGELDSMVSLGNGRVGWAYTPDPNFDGTNYPVVMSRTLQWTTYTSTSM